MKQGHPFTKNVHLGLRASAISNHNINGQRLKLCASISELEFSL